MPPEQPLVAVSGCQYQRVRSELNDRTCLEAVIRISVVENSC